MSDLVDFVALSLLPLWWFVEMGSELHRGRPAAEILELLLDKHPGHAQPPAVIRAQADALLRHAAALAIDVVGWQDAAYPAALAAIADPPPVIWLRGSRAALDAPAVAIVGARSGSHYALAIAERLAADLASGGVLVVSGLARGVDSAAHRGALTAGTTVAVLGCGIDRVYPPEHVELADQITQRGALVSELMPGTAPRAGFFPRRNRIISGLSRAVVVIEAGEKSGSLITARCALDQGRDVLAVPGNVLNGRNRGGHGLLRDGAKIVETADDIFEELHLVSGAVRSAGALSASDRVAPTDPVLSCLSPDEASDLDALTERSGLAPPRLLTRLFELELRGLVRRVGGGRFLRIDSSC